MQRKTTQNNDHELALNKIRSYTHYPSEILHPWPFNQTNSTRWAPLLWSIPHITYGFPSSSEDLAEVPLSSQPPFVDKQSGLTDLSSIRPLIAAAFTTWEQSTNIHFSEAPAREAFISVFGFKEKASSSMKTYGYAGYPDSLIGYYAGHVSMITLGINTNLFATAPEPMKPFLILHEIGHVGFGIHHPFEVLSLANPCHKLTSFSIMNYVNEFESPKRQIIPITPMPFDIEAAQQQYGSNTTSGVGNNTYHVNNLLPKFSNTSSFVPLASFPWDNNGQDTVSAAGIQTNVTLDLTHYGRSKTSRGYLVMPKIDVENIIGGQASNRIVLNGLDNNVDIQKATEQNSIVIDPTNCGHDIIFGFNPKRDRILLHNTNKGKVVPRIAALPSDGCVVIGKNTLCYIGGTEIEFDHANSVVLANTTYIDSKQIKIAMENVVQQNCDALVSTFSNYPSAFFNDFTSALTHGTVTTFLTTLTENSMREFNFTDRQINIMIKIMQALIILQYGLIVSTSLGFMTSSVMTRMNFAPQTVNVATMIAANSYNALHNLSLFGVARMATSVAGGYAGARFALWTCSKLPSGNNRERLRTAPKK